MLDVLPTIRFIESEEFQRQVAAGRITIAEALSSEGLRQLQDSQLPPELFQALLPLLQVTSGLEIVDEAESPTRVLSVDFGSFEPEIWQTTYPVAAEIGVFDEFLYWDLLGEPAGRVFFVDHEGPSHCHAFESFSSALKLFVGTTADQAWEHLASLPTGREIKTTIADFEPDTSELARFIERFPDHFWVHDFRVSQIGDAFYYNLTGPDGLARWGRERLFVQREPQNWLEKVKWWWNPNLPQRDGLQPIRQTFGATASKTSKKTRTEEEMVAYALEAPQEILPFMPELLADLEELGSDAELIAEVLGDLALPDTTRVIDLGCGKGATAVEIATELGWRVLGIELFEPLLEDCRAAAAKAGVTDLCEFRQGNILEQADVVEPAGVVIFSALGDVLGPLDATVEIIRRYANPGGIMLISDGYISDEVVVRHPGFENYAGHAESLRRLEACGDTVLREIAESDTDVGEDQESLLIRARAEKLAEANPVLRDALLGFAESQAAENEFLAQSFVGTLWLLQRALASAR